MWIILAMHQKFKPQSSPTFQAIFAGPASAEANSQEQRDKVTNDWQFNESQSKALALTRSLS
jgi:hypothetical protein